MKITAEFAGRMGRVATLVTLLWISLLGLTTTLAQTRSASVCPTCEPWNLHDSPIPGEPEAQRLTATYGPCDSEERPLTSAIERDFDLDRLRAFLQGSNTVQARSADEEQNSGEQAETSIEILLEPGEFSYFKAVTETESCRDMISASTDIEVRVDNDLLSFEAAGVLWQYKTEASAHFYAGDDLTIATGTLEAELDTARIHAGRIDAAMYVAPGQLRGDINAVLYYFDDERQLRRHLQGEFWTYADRQPLIWLGFPSDECEDHELPFALNAGIELLGGQSAAALRDRVASRIAEGTSVNAVWKNDTETRVTIDLGEPIAGAACLDDGATGTAALNTDWVVRIPIAGRLRTSDARLDMALDELFVGVDATTIAGATLHAWVSAGSLSDAQMQALGSTADVLDAWVFYDFDSNPAGRSGIVNLFRESPPGSFRPAGCLVFPPGSYRDLRVCRYGR